MLYIGVFIFFITFYRLSLFFPSFYLAIFPSILGFLLFLSSDFKFKINKKNFSLFFSFFLLFIYCGILDFFQYGIVLESSFFFRMVIMILLSFFPAYFLNKVYILYRDNKFDEVVKIAFLLQTVFFIIMFLSPSLKFFIYSLFGMGDSVNLSDHNISTRGFGLSAEINFMSPSLMVFMAFLIFRKNLFFKFLIFITQVINSNMALVAGMLGMLIDKSNRVLKATVIISFCFLYYFFGLGFVREYMPRFYEEYVIGGGNRTVNALLSEHFFFIHKFDVFSLFFGFQENISSSVLGEGGSDMGWIIMMNYGGASLIFLFLCFLFFLSTRLFDNKFYAIIWFCLGIIFNTKGMIIGMNGYFFLSFLILLSQRYNKS